MADGQGLVETDEDSVFVDGRYCGPAPWEGFVEEGLHGIRVSGDEGSAWTEVVDLPDGCWQVVAPRFGLETWPLIAHREPGRVLVRGPLLLTASIRPGAEEILVNPRLHMPDMHGAVRDLPLSMMDGEDGIYLGVVDPSELPRERPIRYYFTVQTADGRVMSSELFVLTLVTDLS
jgi:hypothetical protein